MGAPVVGRIQRIDVTGLYGGFVFADHHLDAFAHRSQMHGHVRRVGDQAAVAVEDGAGKVEPFLDVDRIGRVGQGRPHLFGDRHEQVVENF